MIHDPHKKHTHVPPHTNHGIRRSHRLMLLLCWLLMCQFNCCRSWFWWVLRDAGLESSQHMQTTKPQFYALSENSAVHSPVAVTWPCGGWSWFPVPRVFTDVTNSGLLLVVLQCCVACARMDIHRYLLGLGRLCKSPIVNTIGQKIGQCNSDVIVFMCRSHAKLQRLSITYECKHKTKSWKVLLRKAKSYKNRY